MIERQKRLKEVYDHVRKFYGIHTQSDFAKSLRKSRNAITLALNGNESYLTDKLFETICETYKGVFNIDYLLTGRGDLLTVEEDVETTELEKTKYQPQSVDLSSAFNAALAAHVRIIDNLEVQLLAKEKEKQERLAEKDARINDLLALIEQKDENIATLKSVIADLRRQLSETIYPNYGFPVPGVADPIKKPKI